MSKSNLSKHFQILVPTERILRADSFVDEFFKDECFADISVWEQKRDNRSGGKRWTSTTLNRDALERPAIPYDTTRLKTRVQGLRNAFASTQEFNDQREREMRDFEQSTGVDPREIPSSESELPEVTEMMGRMIETDPPTYFCEWLVCQKYVSKAAVTSLEPGSQTRIRQKTYTMANPKEGSSDNAPQAEIVFKLSTIAIEGDKLPTGVSQLPERVNMSLHWPQNNLSPAIRISVHENKSRRFNFEPHVDHTTGLTFRSQELLLEGPSWGGIVTADLEWDTDRHTGMPWCNGNSAAGRSASQGSSKDLRPTFGELLKETATAVTDAIGMHRRRVKISNIHLNLSAYASVTIVAQSATGNHSSSGGEEPSMETRNEGSPSVRFFRGPASPDLQDVALAEGNQSHQVLEERLFQNQADRPLAGEAGQDDESSDSQTTWRDSSETLR